MEEIHGIEVYRVGLLRDIKSRHLRGGMRYLRYQLAQRNWRAVRNYFNGYMAEWQFPPEGLIQHRCGTGWTRKAALRSYGRHLVAANMSVTQDQTDSGVDYE